MKPIVLVGFMGAGKSSVARELGSKLKLPVVDIDECVEKAAGMSITQIFEEHGESEFRKLECAQLAQALAQQHVIIASGGGIVIMPENRTLLCDATVIYLRAKPDTLRTRVGDGSQRPLLKSHALDELLEERERLYEEVGDLTIETDGLSAREVAEQIAKEASQ